MWLYIRCYMKNNKNVTHTNLLINYVLFFAAKAPVLLGHQRHPCLPALPQCPPGPRSHSALLANAVRCLGPPRMPFGCVALLLFADANAHHRRRLQSCCRRCCWYSSCAGPHCHHLSLPALLIALRSKRLVEVTWLVPETLVAIAGLSPGGLQQTARWSLSSFPWTGNFGCNCRILPWRDPAKPRRLAAAHLHV